MTKKQRCCILQKDSMKIVIGDEKIKEFIKESIIEMIKEKRNEFYEENEISEVLNDIYEI